MTGHEITYFGEGYEINIKADTSVKLVALRGAIRNSLTDFKLKGVSNKERTVMIGERTEVDKTQRKEST